MTLMLWVAVAMAKTPCANEADMAAISAEIKADYDAGEAERLDRSANSDSVLARDEKRAKGMLKRDRKGLLCTAEDKWYAAWILTQADSLTALERAHELAIAAMEARHANGAWLVAFTFDLKRVAGGFRQSYGSQTRVNERNQRCLIHVEPDVTDDERKQYGQKPIEEVYRNILDLNAFRADAPTLANVELRGLSCPPLALLKRDERRVAAPD